MLGKLNPNTNTIKPEKLNAIFSLGILLLIAPMLVRVLMAIPPLREIDSTPKFVLSLILSICFSLAIFVAAKSN
jgi:hypothetical protein